MKVLPLVWTRTVLLHLLFWIGVWFLYYYFFSYNSTDREYVIWFSSLLLPLAIAVTYFTVYFLIPRYLLERKYGMFLLYSFYMVVASSYFIVIIIYGCLIFLKKWDATNIPPMMKNFFFILILVYLVAGIIGFITILNTNFKTDRRNKELQNKILNTQLQLKEQEIHYLKRQIHPHFLFNTLNTIYGFALKQSKQTPDVILKLSNLLDYILYQVNKPQVSLLEEVLHIKEYIELERIRFSETLQVSLEVSEIEESVMIAPMLMIPFVENAFKHGRIINGSLDIKIHIDFIDENLHFFVSNTVDSNDEKIQPQHGIGIENIQKRLSIHYPSRHELKAEIVGQEYQISLLIKKAGIIENI